MYKNCIFDLYGTLVDINTDEESVELWEKMAYAYGTQNALYRPEELRKKYNKFIKELKKYMITKTPNYTYIDIALEEVFEKLFAYKNVSVDKKTIYMMAMFFRTTSRKYIKLYDGASELLDEIKKRGMKIYLLTNAQRCFTVHELEYLGIYHKFDDIIISSDEKICKPQAEFYGRLIEKYQLKIEESIMIGNDCTTDIQGAKDIGMDNLYLHTNISPQTFDKTLTTNYLIGFNKDEILKLL